MRLRLAFTVLFALAVAAPVVATTVWFSDVPETHPQYVSIRWAKDQGLFKGYPDGDFKPDRVLSENEFQVVVKRLFDRYDAWTRGETAEFLHAGDRAVKDPAALVSDRGITPTVLKPQVDVHPLTAHLYSKPSGVAFLTDENKSTYWHTPHNQQPGHLALLQVRTPAVLSQVRVYGASAGTYIGIGYIPDGGNQSQNFVGKTATNDGPVVLHTAGDGTGGWWQIEVSAQSAIAEMEFYGHNPPTTTITTTTIRPATTTTHPVVIEPTTTTATGAGGVSGGLESIRADGGGRVFDGGKVRRRLENTVSFLGQSVVGSTASFKVRVDAPQDLLEVVFLTGWLSGVGTDTPIQANSAGVFDYRFQCHSGLSGKRIRWMLAVHEPEPDDGGFPIPHQFWVHEYALPECDAPIPYHIRAAAFKDNNSLGVGVKEKRPTEFGGGNRRVVEPWEYRIRTSQYDCYGPDQPFQPPGEGGRWGGSPKGWQGLYGDTFWVTPDVCLRGVSRWWVELRWPELGEERSTEKCPWNVLRLRCEAAASPTLVTRRPAG